jgi:hypothetical protein
MQSILVLLTCSGADPFQDELSLAISSASAPKPVMLDPLPLSGGIHQDLLNYKTTQRLVYQDASDRASQSDRSRTMYDHLPLLVPEALARQHKQPPPFDVLLHRLDGCNHLITELGTSNIAIHDPHPGLPDWITPGHRTDFPFLCGVMRQELLHKGVLRTGDISVKQLKAWVKEGRVVVGMNALR